MEGVPHSESGQGASYFVPVPTRTAYCVLELFCSAMTMTKDGCRRSVSDILALIKAAHGLYSHLPDLAAKRFNMDTWRI